MRLATRRARLERALPRESPHVRQPSRKKPAHPARLRARRHRPPSRPRRRPQATQARGRLPRRLAGKNIALVFEKPSTRTRCAFVTAGNDEGAHCEHLGKGDLQMGRKESVADT
ncbi:MAG: hypothetical protein IJC63_08400, partial [Myxococcaceae bacterium]|nr:hypothetical protein [Myxococcaceae bacterium]